MTLYETQAQHDRKVFLANRFALHYGCKPTILAPTDTMDVVFHKDGVPWALYAEIKTRTVPRLKYDTFMIDKAKRDWAFEHKQPAIMLVEWTDQRGWLPFHHAHTEGLGGRADRGDPFDLDNCVFYPTKDFNIMEPNV